MGVSGELVNNVLVVRSKAEVDYADGFLHVDGHDGLKVLGDLSFEGLEVVFVKGLS